MSVMLAGECNTNVLLSRSREAGIHQPGRYREDVTLIYGPLRGIVFGM